MKKLFILSLLLFPNLGLSQRIEIDTIYVDTIQLEHPTLDKIVSYSIEDITLQIDRQTFKNKFKTIQKQYSNIEECKKSKDLLDYQQDCCKRAILINSIWKQLKRNQTNTAILYKDYQKVGLIHPVDFGNLLESGEVTIFNQHGDRLKSVVWHQVVEIGLSDLGIESSWIVKREFYILGEEDPFLVIVDQTATKSAAANTL